MAKYRRKEQVVEAKRWPIITSDQSSITERASEMHGWLGDIFTDHWDCGFLVGFIADDGRLNQTRLRVAPGSWVLCDGACRLSVMKDVDFCRTYEPVEDDHEAYKLARDLSDKLEAAYLEALPGLARAARHLRDCVMLNANGQLPGGAVNVAVNRLNAVLGAPPFMGYCVEEETFQQKTDKAIKSVEDWARPQVSDEASACAAGVQDEDEHQVFQRWVDEMACISILEQQNAHKASWINHLLGGFGVPDYTKGVVTAEGVIDA